MLFIRLLLLCLPILGYILFLNKRFRVDFSFAPAITSAFIMAVVFFGGILGVLRWSAYLVLLLGVFLLIWMLIKKPSVDWKKLLTNPALIFLGLSSVLLLLRFQNRVLYSYDDFSHWGTMVKSMLDNNCFPTSENSFITFQSYPPGSSCWIYFVAQVLGEKEGVFLFAHAMLTLSFLSTLFGFFNKRRWYDLLLPLVGVIFIYTNALDPNCLGVDVLLAAAGLASVLTIYRYRNRLTSYFLLILPMVFSTILIKNSGIYFAFVSMMLCLAYLYAQESPAQQAKYKKHIAALVLILVPIAVLLIWHWHVAAAFEDGLGTKHALSLENFLQTWQDNKNSAAEMLKLIFLLIINPKKDGAIYVLCGLIIFAVLDALLRRDRKTNQQNMSLILVLILCTLLYEIGVAGMYIFSMPANEFFYQNGGDYIRYNSTLVDFLCGISIAFCGVRISKNAPAKSKLFRWILRVGTLALLLICLLPYTKIERLSPTYRTDLEARVEQFKEVLAETPVPLGGSYYVKATEDEAELTYFFIRYQFSSGDVSVTTDAVDSSEIVEIVSSYTAYINWVKLSIYTEDSFDN